jgi:TolB-like protein
MRRIAFLFLIGLLFTVLANVAFSQENELVEAINELADRLAFANEGYVRSVSGDTVYIDLGQDSGIFEGMRFEVVRLGEAIVSEGVIIGHQEEIIGEVEITRVRAQMSLASIINKSKEIVEGNKVYQLTKQIQRIAITEFPYGERFNDLSKDIEDRFYTAMIQRGVQVVERERLTEILVEQAMEWTGLFDLSSAAELGKLLGVEGVLIGSLTDQGDTLAIRGRLVDVETAQAITAGAVSINKTPSVVKALSSGIREGRDTSLPEAHETALGEQSTAEGLLFFDDFTLRQDEKWEIESGTWTVINNRFTPVERTGGTSYIATVYVGQQDSYIVETDVYLGSYGNYSGCKASASMFARRSKSSGANHNVWVHLSGGPVATLTVGGVSHPWDYQLDTYTSAYNVGTLSFRSGDVVHVKIRVEGSLYTVYRDGKQVIQYNDTLYDAAEPSAVGLIVWYPSPSGLSSCGTPKNTTSFDNFRISVAP